MTITIPRAVATQIRTEADATDGSDRQLDQVAERHGLMLAELRTLISKPTRPPQPASATKRCTSCGQDKPTVTGFYADHNAPDGLSSNCADCNNRRRPTVSRMLRNRARTRAAATLAKRHPKEFADLMATELAAVRVEHEALTREAGERGQHDAGVARLRPGPKRQGETAADRLDVARCSVCHTHHDADHQCPSCGETTPDAPPSTKPYVVREWAVSNGVAVPRKGPIPQAVLSAYLEHHSYSDADREGHAS